MKQIVKKIFQKIYMLSIPRFISTSLSDNQAYPQVCLKASYDYRFFNKFRRDPVYKLILEHVSKIQGKKYLDLIIKDKDIYSKINEFKKNDIYGNPIQQVYPSIGQISPTTLRYIKVLTDLKYYFGNLNNLNICEIGVGYGGQCRIINAYFEPGTYFLIDIKPALMLTQRYLDNFVLNNALANFHFCYW